MINRILISSDFLMTRVDEQARNCDWLFKILHRPITKATKLPVVSFPSDARAQKIRQTFFKKSDLLLDENKTQAWFDIDTVTPEAEETLRKHLRPTDLLIGYELSEQTRTILNHLGVAWIDLWLHPIRYLDDVLFAFSASSQEVYEAIKTFHTSSDVFDLYADRLHIQFERGHNRQELDIKEGAALFIGQTYEDKSVCDHGKMLSVLDFKERFEELGKKYGHVYYSPHPYQREEDKKIHTYLETCSFAEITDIPAYRLIGAKRLAKVAALSSSLIYEARHFENDAEFWFSPPFSYGTTFGKDYLSIYQEFVSPHFWAQALAPLMETKPCERVMFLSGKDKLRDMLSFYWSYHHIDKAERFRREAWDLGQKIGRIEKSIFKNS